MTRLSLSALVLVALGAATIFAQSPMRPGRWEVTMQMQMANMPMQMPEMKTTQCVTEAQLKDPASAVPSASARNNASCKVSDYKVVDNMVSWKVACTGQETMTGTGEMTFTGDTYVGLMKLMMAQGEMSMKTSGKRLGDCTP
jgi:hypothetical protein